MKSSHRVRSDRRAGGVDRAAGEELLTETEQEGQESGSAEAKQFTIFKYFNLAH